MIQFHELLRKIAKHLKRTYFRKRVKKAALKEGRRLHLSENGYVFYGDAMKSLFYLPYYETEFIQQEIVSTGNYYDYASLKYVTQIVEGGAISSLVKCGLVLDVGANIGNHSLFFLKECDALKVHCFEPIPQVFNILQKNIEINQLQDRVVLHQVGVGSKTNRADVNFFNKGNMGSTILEYSKNGCIPIVAIDDLDLKGNVALVKIDVEGFEVEVIQGMMKTITQSLPYIMMEVRNDNMGQITEMLHPLGYWYVPISKGIDYLFIPQKML